MISIYAMQYRLNVGGLLLALTLGAAPVAAQGVLGPSGTQAPALTQEQVRTRILDTCMVDLSRQVDRLTPTAPACSCYANGLVKVMNEADVAAFARDGQVPSRLRDAAAQIYAQCRSR